MKTKEELIAFYLKHANENNIQLNPDKKIVDMILKGLMKNGEKFGENYCPCRRVTGNKEDDKKIICPCIYHFDEIENDGHCHCMLFTKK
ncbi:MAG: ferredoxin-thioredoxin reductase catalytic domain-containing protein [archaeon]